MAAMRWALLVASVALVASPPPASATSAGQRPDPHAPDPCKSEWIQSLGGKDVPCETWKTGPILRCEMDRPYYTWLNRFRWYADGEWSQWWMYARTYSPAPAKACSG